ncbi:MAG: hypothetical protein R2758_15265 [Bacteroidales bacterium]
MRTIASGIVIRLDSVIPAINSVLTPEMTADVKSTMSNVSAVTADLRQLSPKPEG